MRACSSVPVAPCRIVSILEGLQNLDCDNNQLTFLPKNAGQLAGLQTSRFHNNQLPSLPESLGQLTY